MQLEYHTKVQTNSPIIQAAAALATAGHAGQSRGKSDPNIPYIVHPIMVYELLVAMGETDELTLAAALMHDVKEDNKRYRQDPDAFTADLENYLRNYGVTDAPQIAHCLNKICDELTNADRMMEGKRLWQAEHAAHLSLRASKVKLLDQTASVLDYIMMPNEENFPNDKVSDWNYKALHLVKAVAAERPQLKPWRDVHKVIFSYAMKIIHAGSPEAESQLRQAFSWETAVEAAKNMPQTQDVAPKETLPRKNLDAVSQGIISVTFGETGDVIGYTCLADPTTEAKEPRNHVAINMMNLLESSTTTRRITPSVLHAQAGRMVRDYKIKPPIAAEQFFGIALNNGAADNTYIYTLRNAARAIQSETMEI